MKKILLYAILIISVSMALTSCKGGSNEEVGEASLTFSTFLEEGEQADAYKEIISMFEESHKNIKVNLQSQSSGYDDAIMDALQNDRGPDIIGLQRTKMIDYINQGYIKDISEWVNNSGIKDKYYGVSLSYGKYDGKYYGIGDLPYAVEWYYNKDIFKKAGISEPQNIDELIAACSKLKRYTQNPIIIGAKDPWVINTVFGAIAVQTIDTEELSKAYGSGDKQQFKDLDGASDAINTLYSLVKSGAISSRVADYDYATSVNEFVKGRAAILPMGSWAAEKIEKEMPKGFNYGVLKTPIEFVSNPKSAVSATAIHVVTVNEKSKHQKEAMEFMEFLFSEEAQKVFADKNGISGLKSVNSSTDDEIRDRLLEHLELTNENSTMYVDNISSKMMEVTGNRLLQVIRGKLKPQQTWDMIVDESLIK